MVETCLLLPLTLVRTHSHPHIFTACLYNCLALAMCIHSFVCIFYTWHICYFRSVCSFLVQHSSHRATPFQRKTFQFSMMSIAFFKFSTASKRVVLLWCSPLSFGPSHSQPFCYRTPTLVVRLSFVIQHSKCSRASAEKCAAVAHIYYSKQFVCVLNYAPMCVYVCVCRHNIASHIRVYAFEYKLHTKSHGNAIYERGLNYIFWKYSFLSLSFIMFRCCYIFVCLIR